MKTLPGAIMLAVFLALGAFMLTSDPNARWAGVDETVVERHAEKAGRPAREPFINTDRGDLLIFLFLLAGTIGGFMAGYCFRGIFPGKKTGHEGCIDPPDKPPKEKNRDV